MVSVELEEPITTSFDRTGLEYNSQTTRGVGANVFKAIVELEEPITTEAKAWLVLGQTVKAVGLNIAFGYAEEVKSVRTTVLGVGANTRSVTVNIVYYSWRTKDVKLNIPFAYNENLKDIQAKINLPTAATKLIRTNVIRRGKSLKPIQTKIWWDSSKTLRSVQAKIGSPADTKLITARVGFPANTKAVGLKTPSGYSEIWKFVKLKVEKYSELVTRIVVADTRQTAYSYITKPVVLNIGKFPYNSRPVRLKLLSPGETVKSVGCNLYGVEWRTIRAVGCKVNKSRQIIDVGCNVFLPRSQTLKSAQANIWWDYGESTTTVVANVVSTYLGTATKSVRAKLPTPAKTYRVVEADVSPTHRWTPVSCDVVNQSTTHRGVRTNIIHEVWAFDWQTITTKIEKYAQHTKNIRARRKVQAKIHYYEVFNTRPVSANISTPVTTTRAVKLKIHMYSIYGTITDKDGEPVKDATVFLYKRGSGEFVTPKTVKTNYDGSYEIPEVPYGKYYVLAIKLAHDLNFSPIVMNGAHVDVEKNMPCYEVSKDVCIEEILSPIGDVFRFQVIYDETFADGTRITDILLIWGDLYGNLPTLYRDTDGIFMVESPSSARLTVLHDFWETGGSREEGKDDHFMEAIPHLLPSNKCYCYECKREIVKETGTEGTPCSALKCPYCGGSLSDMYYTNEPTTKYPSGVSWFNWKASLYHPNFVGFIVRSVSRANVYTILSANIGGYYEIPASPPGDPVLPSQRLPPRGGGVTGGRTVHASASPQTVVKKNVERTPCIEDTHEVFEYCSDGITEKKWRDCIGGEWVEGSLVCCEGEHEVLEYCSDGITEKRWRDCIGGEWVEGSLVCCEGEHEVLEYCPDGVTEKRWRDCIGGTWVEDSQVCCSPEGAHEILEWCPDGIIVRRWRDCVNGMWVEGSQVCCSPEGAHEVLEYCPDAITEKKWRDCVGGMWVEDSRVCPVPWLRPVRCNIEYEITFFRPVRCTVRHSVTCRPTIYLPYTYGPGFDIHPNIMGYILARPQWFQNVKTVTVSIGSPKSTTKQITSKVGLPATSRPVRCTVNHYVAASTKAVQTNIGAPVVASNAKSVSCKLPLFWRGSNTRGIRMDILKISAYPVPVSGEVLVIDKDTGYLLYVCTVGNDGFYSFSVPPNKCYYLIINKYGYRSRMQEICIGYTPLVDRNTKEYGGDIFDCEINCYYYIRGFEFPALTQAVIGKIYGHVYNSRTLELISNALVIVDDYAWGATTDENGYYEVFVITGTHKMKCSHGKRYKRAEATAVVASDTEQDFYLDPVVRVGITFTGGLTHKPIYIFG